MTSDFEMTLREASAVLPAQMSGGMRWDANTSGPRALMLAVLEDAVRCIDEGRMCRRFHTRRLAAEAEAWVHCDRGDWPFSFVNICEVIGFDVDAVRARLLTSQRGAARRSRRRVYVPSELTRPEPRGYPGATTPREGRMGIGAAVAG